METKLTANGRPVDLSTEDRVVPGRLRLTVRGEERTIEVLEVGSTEVVLEVDGARRRLVLAADPAGGTWVAVDGRVRHLVEVAARRRGAGPEEEAGAVTPAFPATVVKVLVSVGDVVEKGQGLVVVSAMKTEMTLSAPHAGTVKAVSFEVGASVSPGDVLVEIEEPEGGGEP